MISFLHRLRQDEGGYGMAFASFTLFTLVCFVAYTVNVSEFSSRRIKTQGAVDSGVYSGAKQQSDMLTAIAVINIVMRVLYGIYMIGFVLYLIPFTTAIGRAIMQVCQIALIALSFVERALATAYSYIIMSTISSKISDNMAMGSGGSQGDGLAFASEILPALLRFPMGALYFLIDDKMDQATYIGNYMKADDRDDRLPIITVGANFADDVSGINIEEFGGVRITPLVFYDDDDFDSKKHTFFDKGIMGMAKWSGTGGGNPPLLGGHFFENPDQSAGLYGSAKVIGLGASRAWNSNFKRSALSGLDNHYRTGWKPKLINMREAGLFGAGDKDNGQDIGFAAIMMGEIGIIMYILDQFQPILHH